MEITIQIISASFHCRVASLPNAKKHPANEKNALYFYGCKRRIKFYFVCMNNTKNKL